MDIIDKTLRRAINAAKQDGRLRFVFATAYGPKISLRDIVWQTRYVTNGGKLWLYDEGARLTPENGQEIQGKDQT